MWTYRLALAGTAFLLMVLVAIALALGASASSPSSSSAALKTACVSNTFQIQLVNTLPARFLMYNSGVDRVELQLNSSDFCSDIKGTFTNGEIIIEGLNNMCATYTGARSGPPPLGYLRAVTCGRKASQLWSYNSSLSLTDAYNGTGYVLDAPRLGGVPYMAPYSGVSSQQFVLDNF